MSFDRGLQQCLPRLRRFAHTLCRDGADADDLTQATAERAWKARSQYQDGTRLDSWLFRIMRNQWIDTVRARGRRGEVEVSEEAGFGQGHDPRSGLEAALDLASAMKAMDRLPDEQREVVALILVEGFGYREVAEMLELPIGTVSSRLVRGRNALLAMLGER